MRKDNLMKSVERLSRASTPEEFRHGTICAQILLKEQDELTDEEFRRLASKILLLLID